MALLQARGMFKRQLNREWSQHIARGWAWLLPDRLRGFTGAPGNGDYAHPGAHRFGRASGTKQAQ